MTRYRIGVAIAVAVIVGAVVGALGSVALNAVGVRESGSWLAVVAGGLAPLIVTRLSRKEPRNGE